MRSRSLLRRLDRLPRPERGFCIWDGSALDYNEVMRAQELLSQEELTSAEKAELVDLVARCSPAQGSPTRPDLPQRGDLVLSRDDMAL